ncbi:MAG: redoxin domain-containing protein [Planctomycetales bacterium]
MMIKRWGILTIFLAVSASADAASIVKVQGRIVDVKGNPVVGARISDWWFAERSGVLEPQKPSVSGKDGRFTLELEVHDRDAPLMVVDATGTQGAVASVLATAPSELLDIRLTPLAETHVRYVSEGADQFAGDAYVTWSVGGERLAVAGARSRAGAFGIKLPPGRYHMRGEESRHLDDVREITLEAGKPADLGEIQLPLSQLAKLFGKPAPVWHITDARGVSKEVQPRDFRGKWVVLEFWGYWCGPCTQRGLPGWMDFVDAHSVDSEKFVVLAVHDPKATDFEMLDKKLAPIIRRTWRGRALPFPILLDTSGRFVEDYGIRHWPTAVLLDPEGRVVDVPPKAPMLGSWACEEFLASKLTPVSPDRRIARALERGLSLGVDDRPLAELLDFYADVCGTAIRLDGGELRTAGIDPDTEVPLKASGTLTLRAWLNLTLDPFGLTYVADGDGLCVVRRTSDNVQLAQPSARQIAENVLVAEALQKKVTFEFQGDSLKQAIATLESKVGETILLDPGSRKAGTIDPNSVLSGSAVDEPLSSALTRLLTPLGLKFVVRNEAIVFTTVD